MIMSIKKHYQRAVSVEAIQNTPRSAPGRGPYAAVHRTCRHAVAIHADRASVEALVSGLRGSGRFALRVRLATNDDIESAARGITCNLCRGLA